MLLHGLDTDVEPLGDLAVLQSGHPAQQKDAPALFGELRHAVVDLMPKPRKIELLFAAVGNQAADISVERIEPAGVFATRFAVAEAINAPVPHGRRQVGQHRTREVDLRAPLPSFG